MIDKVIAMLKKRLKTIQNNRTVLAEKDKIYLYWYKGRIDELKSIIEELEKKYEKQDK